MQPLRNLPYRYNTTKRFLTILKSKIRKFKVIATDLIVLIFEY